MSVERESNIRPLFAALLLSGTALAAAPAPALAVTQALPPRPVFAKDQPVVLHADQMDYDKEHEFLIASGNVEVSQGDTIVLADTLTYDRRNNLVFAQGNVSVLEPSGDVYFANDLELTDNMAKGTAEQFRVRFADGSLFAASQADRVSEDVTVLHNAVYSPCSILCDDGETTRTPLWQMKGRKVTLDRKAQEIYYRDARMELWGVPVAYTPYFAHAMPGADNESGILTPELKRNSNLGTVVSVPLYWAIAPDRDVTITPVYASLESPLLMGEYRQLFDHGQMRFIGSVTRPDDRNALGSPTTGNTTRGHIFARGDFDQTPDWRWGFNIRRTLDDTYLRRYDFSNEPLLTSRLYTEGFDFLGGRRSYAVAQGLAFQGLQQQDDSRRSPLVLPVVDMMYESLPLAYGSRFILSGGVMSLARDLGADSRRVSATGEWILPYITEGGHVFELSTQLRADAYDVEDLAIGGGREFNGQETRVIPQVALEWRYPLVRRFENAGLVIEPMINAIASPNNANTYKIPNEDSAIPEFTDTNLFSDNRFAGYDRVETGPRLNYGLRSQLDVGSKAFFDVLVGQAYRVNDDPLFPISNDLSSRFSDYVGRLGMTYDMFSIAYRFRRDKDTFSSKRDEVEAALSLPRFGFGMNYLDIRNDPILASKEEISSGMSYRFTRYWSWNVGGHRDMLLDRFTHAYTGFNYTDECMTVLATAGRDFTSDRDFKESNTFKLQVFLKNLN